MTVFKGLFGLAFSFALTVSTALAGELVINSDQSDPAPKKAMEELIADFQAKNPDIKVKWNNFDHEGYKSAIRNFLTADPPDVAAWYAGNRMAPFVKAGLFEPVDDVWEANGFNDQLKSTAASMTIDGKKWGVPYTYYQWGIYYNKEAYKKAGVTEPKSWAEFVANCEKFKAAGIDCLTTGTKALWPGAGIFDYLNLRVNGYEFHMDLANGKVPVDRSQGEGHLRRMGEDRALHHRQPRGDRLAGCRGTALAGQGCHYVMGNFAVADLQGRRHDQRHAGLHGVPGNHARNSARRGSADRYLPHSVGRQEQGRREEVPGLSRLARGPDQDERDAGQLPTNNKSTVGDDPFIKAGFEMLSSAYALAQFFDRDAPADMAKAGMEGFQEFMVKPENVDAILERLEKVRQKVYK